MKLTPQLSFNGQCRQAFEFYTACLGGSVTFLLTWGDSPMAGDVPASMHDKVCHATFQLAEDSFGGSDCQPDQYEKPQGITLTLNPKTVEEAERVFAALGDGGTVQMPLQATFWASRFGMVTDKFGIPWVVNCEQMP
jgi:PhnB protein